jgi:uncharacterized membrane protein YeiB
MFVRTRKKTAFLIALWILIVASLVIMPKFVVSRSHNTQAETCDPIFAADSKQYIPPC